MTTTVQEIIDAVNAYADAQLEVNTLGWFALTHRSSRSPAADTARAVRDAGRGALDLIQEWPVMEMRAHGARVLKAPDGTCVLYYCERRDRRTLERLTTDLRANQGSASHE